MHWLLLFTAIVFELCGTTAMKLSNGFTRPVPSVLLFVCYILCLVTLTFALKKIDLSVAYAIWSGLGTAAVVLMGVVFFKEPISLARAFFMGLILVGVVGLKMTLGK